MNDEAIHIPARKKQQTGAQMVVKVTPEACMKMCMGN